MTVLIGIAVKSLVIAGLALCLLKLMASRSAAERSWIAHIGLLALVVMALGPLVLPKWTVEAPVSFGSARPAQASPTAPMRTFGAVPLGAVDRAKKGTPVLVQPTFPRVDAVAAVTAVYAIPAATLLIITFLALLRLFALRTRAEVLVDGHWLSALARAQRRMGFKHGTALLTSNELASPISWGLMRPVILLNDRAIEAADEAEAIIAHELAHVARMDWMKLLLARVATALFWFNPIVWVLAREAHQLREEAADDSVLSADIRDTDYAQLLVGIARHECPGLLLGAHGVAPSRNSLARRVARVLDGKSVRRPVARSFALGVVAGGALIAAPLAALTVTSTAPRVAKTFLVTPPAGHSFTDAQAYDLPADLPHLIAKGVSTSVSTASAAIVPHLATRSERQLGVFGASRASIESGNGTTVPGSPSRANVAIYPTDRHGGRRLVAIAGSGATVTAYADADDKTSTYGRDGERKPRDSAVQTAIEMKVAGITPEYAAAMRAASSALRAARYSEIIQLKWLGVTPDYVRELSDAGFADLQPSQIEQARALGISPGYLRAIRATGVPVSFSDVIELRAMGVQPDELARMRAAGDLRPENIRSIRRAPRPPRPPQPPQFPQEGPGSG